MQDHGGFDAFQDNDGAFVVHGVRKTRKEVADEISSYLDTCGEDPVAENDPRLTDEVCVTFIGVVAELEDEEELNISVVQFLETAGFLAHASA